MNRGAIAWWPTSGGIIDSRCLSLDRLRDSRFVHIYPGLCIICFEKFGTPIKEQLFVRGILQAKKHLLQLNLPGHEVRTFKTMPTAKRRTSRTRTENYLVGQA